MHENSSQLNCLVSFSKCIISSLGVLWTVFLLDEWTNSIILWGLRSIIKKVKWAMGKMTSGNWHAVSVSGEL